jgi:tetratricopeptide (TPR) repeat protein
MNRFDKAIADFMQALKVNPNKSKAYSGLGYVYFVLGDYKKAIEYFSQSLQIRRDELDFVNRGLSYYKLGDFESAIQDLTRAIELNPESGEVYYHRAFLYRNRAFQTTNYQLKVEYEKKARADLAKSRELGYQN